MSSTSGQDIHGQGSLESGTGSFPEASAREFADKDGSLRRILLGWGGFLVRRFVDVEDNEVQPVIRAFCSFLLLMAAYFLCMPLRDEAGMSLGTGALPFLFVASLVVTIIAAPASSALLTRPDISKGRALLLLYRFFGASLLFFFFIYIMVPGNPDKPGVKVDANDLGAFADVPISFLLARAAFFLWVALFNLFTVSAMWARLADAMTSESGTRLFGFIGAGATMGQLLGSLLASLLAGGGPALLILAAIFMELAGWCALKISEVSYSALLNQDLDSLEGGLGESSQMGTVKSHLDFRKSPISSSTRRSTLSLDKNRGHNSTENVGIEAEEIGVKRERERERENVSDGSIGEKTLSPGQIEKLPLVTEETLFDGEKESPLKERTTGSSKKERGEKGILGMSSNERLGNDRIVESGSPSKSVFAKGGEGFKMGRSKVLEGIFLVIQSSYLLQICFFLLMTAIISSFFYFERAAVVAGSSDDPIARRRMLANINSVSAIATVLFQLTLTGRLLAVAGVAMALSAAPLTAVMGMVAIAIHPTPSVVAISEALRKVVNYVLTRPGREILFTVVSREEKYKAKVTIDTLVQRLGDAMAAAVFRLLGSGLKLGPAGMAAFSIPLCVVWLLSGYFLGRRQQNMALSRPPTAWTK